MQRPLLSPSLLPTLQISLSTIFGTESNQLAGPNNSIVGKARSLLHLEALGFVHLKPKGLFCVERQSSFLTLPFINSIGLPTVSKKFFGVVN